MAASTRPALLVCCLHAQQSVACAEREPRGKGECQGVFDAQRVRDINSTGPHTLLQRWKILDRHFLKPLFGGRHFSAAAVHGYPLVAPDGGPEEDDDEDFTPDPGGTPTRCAA